MDSQSIEPDNCHGQSLRCPDAQAAEIARFGQRAEPTPGARLTEDRAETVVMIGDGQRGLYVV